MLYAFFGFIFGLLAAEIYWKSKEAKHKENIKKLQTEVYILQGKLSKSKTGNAGTAKHE